MIQTSKKVKIYELVQAIEESHILIVIFSIKYASSTWCLQEPAKIAEYFEVSRQTVLPIFYDVSPSDVRKQSGMEKKILTLLDV